MPANADIFGAILATIPDQGRKYAFFSINFEHQPTPTEKILWMFLCDLAKDSSQVAWPGNKHVATLLKTNMGGVSRTIEELVAKKMLTYEDRRLAPGSLITLFDRSSLAHDNAIRAAQKLPKLVEKKEKPDAGPSLSSDDEKRLACQTPNHMMIYLFWGAKGLQSNDYTKMKPEKWNWENVPGYTANTPQYHLWSDHQIAAWVWVMICTVWFQNKQPLRLPNFGLLLKHVKIGVAKRTKQDFLNFAWHMINHFTYIRLLAGRNFSAEISETSINNSILEEQCVKWMMMTEQQRSLAIQEINSRGTRPPEAQ